MRRALAVLGVVVLALACGAVFLVSFGPNAIKPRIIAAVLQATGRDLTMAGPVRVELSWSPMLVADDVSLSNIQGGSQTAMATVHRVRIRVALLPLLQRALVIDSISLEQPEILLETDAAGRPNWLFAHPTVPAGPVSGGGSAARMQVEIRRMAVGDGKLAWRDGRTGLAGTIALPDMTLTQAGPGAPIHVSGAVAAGTAGQPASVVADIAAPTVNLRAQSGDASLTVSGSVAQPQALAGLNLQVGVRVPDLAILGLRSPVAGPMSFDGHITGDVQGRLALHGFALSGPAGAVSGDITLDRAQVPALRGTLTASRIDLDAIPSWDAPAAASPAAAPTSRAPVPPRLLIPDTPLKLNGLRAVNADLAVAVADLVRGGVNLGTLGFHLVLSGGRLTLDPITGQIAGSKLQASLTLDASQPEPASVPFSLHLRAPGLAAGPVLAALRLPGLVTGPLDVLADLHGAGRTPHAMASGLDGTVGLAMENGALNDGALRQLLSGILRSAKLPPEVLAAAGESAVRCTALRLDFAAGRGTVRALLLDTSSLHVEGDGEVNLADETLALNLRPLARLRGAGIAVPLRVSGRLESPRGQIDAGELLGDVANGGGFRAVIGALTDTGTANSCGPELAVARGAPPPPAPKPGKTIDFLEKLFR